MLICVRILSYFIHLSSWKLGASDRKPTKKGVTPRSQGRVQACPGFIIGGKTEGPKAESGGGVLAEGQQPPPQLGSLGEHCEPRPPKGFPLFSALRMPSPDTIILLIVDYHAAIEGPKTPLRTTLSVPPFMSRSGCRKGEVWCVSAGWRQTSHKTINGASG